MTVNTYTYIYVYYSTRKPLFLVCEVYIRSCRTSTINSNYDIFCLELRACTMHRLAQRCWSQLPSGLKRLGQKPMVLLLMIYILHRPISPNMYYTAMFPMVLVYFGINILI